MLRRILQVFAFLITSANLLINLYCYTYPSLDVENCSWKYNYKTYNSIQKRLVQIPYIGDLYDHYFVSQDPNLIPQPNDIHLLAIGDPQINGVWPYMDARKRLDIFGNDFYLGHIYSVVKRRLQPDYVAVLGDLISCNWVSDSEYFNRTKRYSTRIFPRPEAPYPSNPEAIDILADQQGINDLDSYVSWYKQSLQEGLFSTDAYYHYQDVANWSNDRSLQPLFINTTGNHDVGYGGEISFDNLYRWNRFNGKDNYWIDYGSNTSHPWRLVVLNSLVLDGPVKHQAFQNATWQFIDSLATKEYNGSTILITHIPLYKPEGVCADGPRIEYFTRENSPVQDWDKLGNIKQENLLTEETSQRVLSSIFKNGKPGLILTGHDHEGCVSYYSKDEGIWVVNSENPEKVAVREVTVRSIMGDFDGNTGIVTGHFSHDAEEWEFDYRQCPFIVQHVWWASKVVMMVDVSVLSVLMICR
ncbi:DEKNAAC103330 [Brettanomyces naardenensis]|uniref:DEKNAAC103330 n=1 Tax=Brettanomyces naardenensis TaxID=13370 RepID=A0A448YNE1_BRENA|nr:DEKNAAC103330 [Brettanomyces naardenensis]